MDMKTQSLLEFLKNEFVYGGHLLSLGAASIVFTAAMLLGIKITWDFLLASYLITYVVYAYNRLVEFRGDFLTNQVRTQHIKGYINILPIVIITLVVIIFSLSVEFGNPASSALILLMIVNGLLYSIHFKKLTKEIVGFKSFYVSLFWALLIFLLILYYNAPLTLVVIALFLFVFLRLVVNTTFFDIKDIESDKLQGLKTFPVYLGKDKVLFCLKLLNFLSFIPLAVCIYKGDVPFWASSFFMFFFYSQYYLFLAKSDNTNIQKLSYFMVDGEYILWPIIGLIFKNLVSL